jgi:hypothetical protein
MAFELRYPNHTSPTTSWVPLADPTPDYGQLHYAPSIIHQMADRKTAYGYLLGSVGDEYAYMFQALSDAEKASLETFLNTVLMQQFELNDPVSGAWVVVVFHPEMQLELHWAPFGPTTWKVPIRLLSQ